MNNAPPPMSMVNPVVMLLQQLMEDAKANRITSIGIVAVTPQGQLAALWAGPQRGDVYVGSAMLQKRMLHELDPPPDAKRPTIVRATMAG